MDSVLVWGVFGRALGLVAAIHFLSIANQILPLVGSKGLEPAHLLFRAIKRDLHPLLALVRFPSLFLIRCSDRSLLLVCYAGLLASLGVVAGLGEGTPVCFLVAWLCWLSIQTSNPTLFSFPWDLLLSEALFFAALVPPFGVPIPAVAFYFNWLLFRVIFGMGITRFRKLGETERDLTYVYHFYQWQPMPTPIAFYLRTLPMWFHKLSYLFLFLVEVVAVFGIFGPPSLRAAACVLIVALQLGIWASGNYGTFNILTIILCLPLLLPLPVLGEAFNVAQPLPLLLMVHFVLSLPTFLIADFWTTTLWLYHRPELNATRLRFVLGPFAAILRFLAPFRLVNSFGVFRYQEVYLRDRLVMRIQGTTDGTSWHDYETKFLSSQPEQRPRFFAPYHPRLDHYLFYGLSEPHSLKMFMLMACNPYYFSPFCLTEKLVQKLLRNDEVAVSFFRRNPFSKNPPIAIRYALFRYNFTTLEEKAASGVWWKTDLLGASEPIRPFTVQEDSGINTVYDRFISESMSTGRVAERTLRDPGTGKIVKMHLHPVRREMNPVESQR
jgi:hypothetical protein